MEEDIGITPTKMKMSRKQCSGKISIEFNISKELQNKAVRKCFIEISAKLKNISVSVNKRLAA